MSKTQAVLFELKYWTTLKSRAWLKKHNYKAIERVKKTKNYYRYRLLSPKKIYIYSSVHLPNHIRLIKVI